MRIHLRAGMSLTGVPALSFYNILYGFRQSITKMERLFFNIKSANKALKNHYINPYKTSINKDKTTDKRQACNRQKIN